jgi:BatD DUF11 like domain/Bacterial SH3 domain
MVQQVDVTAAVDRDEVDVGDEIVLTITAQVPGSVQVEILQEPTFVGLTLVGTQQGTSFRAEGGGVRITTWQYQLRGNAPGHARIGAAELRVGDDDVRTQPIDVTVKGVDDVGSTTMAPRLARIVDGAPGPDGSDDVIVTVVPSQASVTLGEQLDLVVVAWFPRDVRTRLRTRPTLTPPEIRGAWTYSQTSALGVSATRQVGRRSYDLFVHHQVVFPLTTGPFVVGPATVSYNLPLRMSILSREVPQEVQSAPFEVAVRPQPARSRPADFGGAAAADFQLSMVVDTTGFATGNGGSVALVLSGRGNVSLWPEPVVEWPADLRVYPGHTDVRIESDGGIVGGVKTFDYLVAADSAGSFAIPPARFTYFDLDTRRYQTATTEPVRLVARLAVEREARHADAPAIVSRTGAPFALRIIGSVPLWVWIAVGGGPPLVALAALVGVRLRRAARRRRKRQRGPSGLAQAQSAFDSALERLVPGSRLGDSEELASALRAAGIEAPVALHATRIRDRLRQAVYGPTPPADPAELIAEVGEVLRALRMEPGRRRSIPGAAAAVVVAVLLVPWGAARGQTPENLYQAGVYLAAADSFARRAAREPNEAAHWINLGLSLVEANDEPGARAAWLRAARLRPRDDRVKQVQTLLGELDPVSKRMVVVYPVTAAEALLVAAFLWLSGWLFLGLTKRRWRAVPLLVASVLAVSYAAYVHHRYTQSMAIVVNSEVPLRTAPYGTASSSRSVTADAVVHVSRSEGAWMLVRRGGAVGWVLAEDLAPL